jgi:hypothetical protein
LFQVASEHRQPIVQAIVGDVAKCEYLVNRGNQRGIGEVVIQIVRDIKPGGTAEDFCGLLGEAVES